MAKFLFTYHGGAGMPETKEEMDQVMAAWGGWFGALGAAVVDGGNPTGGVKTVTSSGTSDSGSSKIAGYGLFEADSHDAAVAMAQGCPVLARGGTVEVHETIDM